MDFDFRPDTLLSNQALLAEALTSVISMVGTPLAFQLGLTNPQLFYEAVRDYIRARRLDPKKYVTRPQDTGTPPILWEEAISLIQRDEMPVGAPMEGADQHLAKAFEFIKDDTLMGLLTPPQVGLLKAWLAQVGQLRTQQLAVQAAGQFQQGMMAGGPTGAEPMPAELGIDPRAALAPAPPAPQGAEGA